MKKRSESKMLWGVHTYQEWRGKKLSDVSNYNEDIFNANLDDLKNVTISNLENSLCIFIAEVTKSMVMTIQVRHFISSQYLSRNF